jgi:hypothetical protein
MRSVPARGRPLSPDVEAEIFDLKLKKLQSKPTIVIPKRGSTEMNPSWRALRNNPVITRK